MERTNPDLAGWFSNFRETVTNLRERRAHCQSIANETLQNGCMTAWNASLAIEILRLRNDLNGATDRGSEVWGELSLAVNTCRSDNPVVDGEEFAHLFVLV